MTLKGTFIPWNVSLPRDFFLEPLTCGLYINTVYGHEFWSRQPGRYPDKYYEALSTKARINVFLGQRIGVYVPHSRRKFVKEIRLFYEVSTCDLYVVSAFTNSYLKPHDYLRLSFGLRFKIL